MLLTMRKVETESRRQLSAALDLVRDSQETGLVLRIAGSLAVLLYCHRQDRPSPPGDIDLVGCAKQRAGVQRFLAGRGWALSGGLLLVSEIRDLFVNANVGMSLDVYYGAIDGSHPIIINEAHLRSAFPAIPIGDLLLSKLQRRRMRDVDVWDCCAVLGLPESSPDDEMVVRAVSRDWGLYRTVMENLNALTASCSLAEERIARMRIACEGSRKSVRWFLRALIGSRVRWWREVYDPAGRAVR
jgi:hypothetical protein